VERGSRLITQLLAFSKNHEMQVHAASINDLVEDMEHVLRHAAGPDVALVFDKAEGLPFCKADQTQFDAALVNLVVNARQAMPVGGTITISTRLAGNGGVELRVADTGTGIAPHDLKRVFEPFFTTKADTGTGLGLAQVYGFMRRIGGDATVPPDPAPPSRCCSRAPRARPTGIWKPYGRPLEGEKGAVAGSLRHGGVTEFAQLPVAQPGEGAQRRAGGTDGKTGPGRGIRQARVP